MTDRNEAVRQREHAQRMFNQELVKFTRLLNEGKTGLLDRFGVQVNPRDLTLYTPDWPLVFDVVDVTPVLDPSHPVGTLNMELRCTVNVKFIAGQRSMNIIKCGRRPEPDAEGKPATADLASPGSEAPSAIILTDADAQKIDEADAAATAAAEDQSALQAEAAAVKRDEDHDV